MITLVGMNKVQVKIPLRPHLYNFVRSELGAAKNEIDINAHRPLGAYIMSIAHSSDRPAPDYGECTWGFNLPERDKLGKMYDGQTCFLVVSASNIKRFNKLLDELMQARLFGKLELLEDSNEANRRSGRMKQTIIDFNEKYNTAAEEMTYDMWRIRYQRWKKRQESLLQSVL